MGLSLFLSVLLLVVVSAVSGNRSFRNASTYASVDVAVDGNSSNGTLNENYIGTNWLNPGTDIPLMKEIGVKTSRIAAGFDNTVNGSPVYNCQTKSWNSNPLDSMVQAGEQAGAQDEIIILATPPCMVANPGSYPAKTLPPDPNYINDWEDLVTQMAVHEIETYGVTIFEIWNEPDWFAFWNGTQAQFFTLYQETALALEKAAQDTNTKIMIGGPTLANVLGIMDTNWLDPFLNFVATNNLPLDFLSWHLYGDDPFGGPSPNLGPICLIPSDEGSPPNPCYYKKDLSTSIYASQTQVVKTELANFPTLHPQLWIDEWNLDALYDPRMSTDFDASYILSSMWEAQSEGVDRMVFYDMSDGANSPPPNGNFGMIDGNGNPKPSWYAFYDWSEMAGTILSDTALPAQDPFGSGGVGAIATKASSGVIHLLLYDFVPYDPSGNYGMNSPTTTNAYVNVTVNNLNFQGYALSFSRIGPTPSDSPDPIGTYQNGSETFSAGLPMEGVLMATLTPSGPAVTTTPIKIAGALSPQTGKPFFGELLLSSFAILLGFLIAARLALKRPRKKLKT